jgi:type II secretory pathway pseudopilin PulG
MTRNSPAGTGFTLIEVVGAVAIVGIWFLVLSTSAFNGIAAESRAQRLFEASLVADEALADAEVQAMLGLQIELETSEYGDLDYDGLPEYFVTVESEPFDPLMQLVAVDPSAQAAAFVDPSESGTTTPAAALLTMQRVRIDVYLAAELEDEGDEAAFPLASRTTFAIDAASLALLTPTDGEALPARDAEAAEGAGADELPELLEELR